MDNVLTNALAEIKALAFSGFGLIEGTADEILWWVVGFSVLGIFIAWFVRPSATPMDAAAPWMGLLILLNIVAACMGVLPGLSDAWMTFMQSVGFYAGGGSGAESLEDVSAILRSGWDSAWVLLQALYDVNILFEAGSALVLSCLILAILVVHVILVFQLFMLFTAFYIFSVLALCLLPFMVWRHTTWMAEGPARYIAVSGVRAAAIAFGFQMVHSMVGDITFDPDMSLNVYYMHTVTILVLLGAVAGIDRCIRDFMSGSPSTSSGHEMRSLFFAASMGASAVRAAMVMGSAAGATGAAGAAGLRSAVGSIPSGVGFNPGWGARQGGSMAGSMATLTGPRP